MSTWSREQVSILIDEYQKHECLYALKTSYKNKHSRTLALEQIQKELIVIKPGVTIQEIKAKINELRTTFLAEYREYQSSFRSEMSQDEVYKPTIWYFQNLYFILDHCQVRSAIDTIGEPSSFSMLPESIDEINTLEASVNLAERSQEFVLGANGVLEPSGDSESSQSTSGQSQMSQHSTVTPCTSRRKRKSLSEDGQVLQDISSVLMNLAEKIAEQSRHAKPDDELLGAFIVSKLKELDDPDVRLQAERKIMNILFDSIMECRRRKTNKN